VSDLRTRLLSKLREDLALCEKASPGPWFAADDNRTKDGRIRVDDGRIFGLHMIPAKYHEAKFIAAARTGWESLIHAVIEEVEFHVPRGQACPRCGDIDDPCTTVRLFARAMGVSDE
jgi:hypothetical protein